MLTEDSAELACIDAGDVAGDAVGLSQQGPRSHVRHPDFFDSARLTRTNNVLVAWTSHFLCSVNSSPLTIHVSPEWKEATDKQIKL